MLPYFRDSFEDGFELVITDHEGVSQTIKMSSKDLLSFFLSASSFAFTAHNNKGLSTVSESKIEKDVCAYAVRLGWRHFKFKSVNNNAVPDRIFLKDGKTVFIEFKATGKVPTELQAKRLRELREMGFVAEAIDSVKDGKQLFDILDL